MLFYFVIELSFMIIGFKTRDPDWFIAAGMYELASAWSRGWTIKKS